MSRDRHWVIILTALSSIPALCWLGSEMQKASDARWGGVALIAGFGLIYRTTRSSRDAARRWPIIIALGFAIFLWCMNLKPWSCGATLLALAFSMMDRRHLKEWPFAALALVLMGLPILRDLHYVGGFPLRVLSGELSAFVLQLEGLDVERMGTGLAWKDQVIEVDAPCSGIKMLWTTTLLALVASAWLRLSLKRTFLICALVLPMVLVANVIRCCALFHLESGRLGWPDWLHESSGALIFTVMVAALLSIVRKLEEPLIQ